MSSSNSRKPIILMASLPLSGHVMPMISLAQGLNDHGHDVAFVTGPAFEDKVKATGSDFIPLTGKADFNDDTMHELVPGRKEMAPSFERTVVDVEHVMVGTIPEQFEALQRAFGKLSDLGRPVLLVTEVLFFGAHPIQLGAPGFKPAGWICIGVLPLLLRSSQTLGLDNDHSPEAHAKKLAMNNHLENVVFAKSKAKHHAICRELGAQDEPKFIWEHSYLESDRFLQLCPPSLEFPRVDLPANVRFAGPAPAHRHKFTAPEWWSDVVSAKRVVVVTQGTYSVEYGNLIIPTLEGLKDAPDTLVVAILGRRGAKLPADFEIPSNARVADYLYYDAILPYAEVFVYNGGYGGLQHSLGHSVPVIIAGDSEDKPMVAARAESAGVAIDLKTGQPTPQQVREAVDSVTSNSKFEESSKKVQKELEEHSSLDILENTVAELASRDFGLVTQSDEESDGVLLEESSIPVVSS